MDSNTLASLHGHKLDAELRKYGAHTSGSDQRKRERLWRFVVAHEIQTENDNHLRETSEAVQALVALRAQARAAEVLLELPPESDYDVNVIFRLLGEEDTTLSQRRCLLRALRTIVCPNPGHIVFHEE